MVLFITARSAFSDALASRLALRAILNFFILQRMLYERCERIVVDIAAAEASSQGKTIKE
jgi:hypothetical protein